MFEKNNVSQKVYSANQIRVDKYGFVIQINKLSDILKQRQC